MRHASLDIIIFSRWLKVPKVFLRNVGSHAEAPQKEDPLLLVDDMLVDFNFIDIYGDRIQSLLSCIVMMSIDILHAVK